MRMGAKSVLAKPFREVSSWRAAGWEIDRVMITARIVDGEVSDRRRADREPVEVEARLRELGREGCEATVLNISATGFMAETPADVSVGSRVWLILPGRERANAVVRWIEGQRIGAEFAEPIDTAGLLAR
ncbi:MAG TPA: PilZ domain-containing protein [Sphingomicrobium sp.]|jgi:hypothetical protein|nr:PilZ domain-containing protein [Sphingomicrobium sp.]